MSMRAVWTFAAPPRVDRGARTLQLQLMPEELLTSGEVARLLGVGPSTVKRWTDAGDLRCVKTLGKHRRFMRAEVEEFARRTGMPLGAMGNGNGAAPAAGTPIIVEEAGLGWQAGEEAHPQRWVELLVGEYGSAYGIHAALLSERARLGAWHRVADAMGSVLEEMGAQWEAGHITVVETNLASERLHRALGMCAESMPVPADAPRCLLATAQSDEHALGLSLADVCLREAGWRPLWAGIGTPPDELSRYVADKHVEMVAVSASSGSGDAQELAHEAEELARVLGPAGTMLVLGGKGRWPASPPHGTRLHSFAELHDILLRHHRTARGAA